MSAGRKQGAVDIHTIGTRCPVRVVLLSGRDSSAGWRRRFIDRVGFVCRKWWVSGEWWCWQLSSGRTVVCGECVVNECVEQSQASNRRGARTRGTIDGLCVRLCMHSSSLRPPNGVCASRLLLQSSVYSTLYVPHAPASPKCTYIRPPTCDDLHHTFIPSRTSAR